MAAANVAGRYSQSYLLSTDHGSGTALRISPLEPLQQKDASDRRKLHLRRRIRLHGIGVQSRAGFRRGTVKLKDDEEITDVIESEPSSGTRKTSNLPGILTTNNQSLTRDNKLVFVAGATGKVGSRTVRELVKLGFRVRASTRNKEKAEALFQDILQGVSSEEEPKPSGPFSIFSPANLFGFLKPKAGKQVDIVECDLESRESIEAALGNAGVVVCCIGASENEVLDVTGPFRIDYKATRNLIDAASEAQINHFVLLTSLGTQKFGFPAAVLNLFWGVLVWKAKAEKALIESGIPYTIVRPGGMERPTDAYKETHNLRLAEADTLFGGQVSNLQVAELIASVVGSFELSKNKILEVVAETTAPLRPIRELLEEIPSLEEETSKLEKPSMNKVAQKSGGIGTQKIFKKLEEEKPIDQKKLQAKKEEEKRKAEEEKRLQLQKAEEEKRKLEALRTKYENEILAAKEKEEEAKSAAEAALAEKSELQKRTAEIRAKAEAAALAARQAKALEAAVLAAAQKGEVLSELEKEKILDAVKLEAQKTTTSLKESKAQTQKTTGIPFFGRFPSLKATETSTDDSKIDTTESQNAQEDEKTTVKARLQSAKLAEKKLQEQKKKEAEALKLEEQEAARIAAAKKKEEQEKAELEAKRLAEQEAARTAEIKREEEEKKAVAEAKIATEKETKPKPEEAAEEKVEVVEKKAAETLEVDKAKVDTENIAKENAEATITDSTEVGKDAPGKTVAPAVARGKGFRWFWQPAVQEEDVPEATAATASPSSEVKPDVTMETETFKLPPSPTPLSPYTRFPELKPPTSPIPSPSAVSTDAESLGAEPDVTTSKTSLPKDATAEKDTEVSAEEPAKETSDEAEEAERKKLVLETMAREKEALERAKSATTFLWPWQKPKRPTEEPAETSASVNLTTEGESLSPISEETSKPVSQSPSTSTVSNEVTKDVPETLPASTRPLSPYAMYPGLRPPTSPTPSPPSPWAKTETVTPSKQESAILEDKQVSSKESIKDAKAEKSEEANGRMTEEDEESKRLLAKEVAEREREALEKAKAATAITWPWQKPETEEQPEEKVVITESNKEETAPPTPVIEAGQQTLLPSSRPLSPYTQFPNLKPPTSPTPSPPSKPIQSEPKASVTQETSTPLSPYSVFPDLKPPGVPTPLTDNGAVAGETVVTEETVASNAGFKWPWQ